MLYVVLNYRQSGGIKSSYAFHVINQITRIVYIQLLSSKLLLLNLELISTSEVQAFSQIFVRNKVTSKNIAHLSVRVVPG